ncbi:MAG: NAD(P)/FAD-dependent oxidoreductase, partial [Planctomycetota bacterium]
MLRWLVGRPDQDEVLLPVLKKNYESTVPGLYIVGDLAGAPTIRTAANQGVEVMAHIGSLPDGRAEKQSEVYDVVVIGGGSSGIAAAMEAQCCANLRTVVLESRRLANTIREFPKGKEIYAEPKAIDYRARLWLEDSVKEELLERWDAQLAEEDLNVVEDEQVTGVKRVQGCFEVTTARGNSYKGRRVVLAIGKRGNPRRLGVPGRRDGFFRLQSKNREKIETAEGIEILFETEVEEIRSDEVVLKGEHARTIPNDCVLVAAGAELPHKLFKSIGIRMEKEWTPWRLVALAAVFFAFWCMYAAKKFPPLWPLNGLSSGD